MSQSTHTASATSPMKVASASLIGTTVEYYDFFIYGTAAALVFPKLFFPNTSPLIGALLSFATLGVGFLARPVGGIVFGHFGDRVGRKKMLVISLVTMGLATTLMGLMPSYAVIGIAAPILLTLLRLVQGFAVGRRVGRRHPDGRRARTARSTRLLRRLPADGRPGRCRPGHDRVLPREPARPRAAFLAWGWRIPFLLSAVLVLVGLVIRLSIAESPEFEKVREAAVEVKMPIAEAFRRHPKEIFLVAGTYLSQGVLAYITMSYLVSYGTTQLEASPRPQCPHGRLRRRGHRHDPLPGVRLAGRPLGPQDDLPARRRAHAGEHHPRRSPLINTGNAFAFGTALVLIFGIAMAPAGGVTGSLFSMIFTPEVRYSGASIGYTISQVCRRRVRPADRHRPLRDQRLERPGRDLPAGRLRDLGGLRAAAARQARQGRPAHGPPARRRRMTTPARPAATDESRTTVPTMLAARLHEIGKPMQLEQVPIPTPRPTDVVVQVKACNVVPNLKNVLATYAEWFPYLPLPQLPAIFGLDSAGVVTAGRRPGPRRRGR